MSPTTNHVSVAILIQVAAEFTTLNLGAVEVAPVERIVVVQGVTASIVGWPAPVIQATFI